MKTREPCGNRTHTDTCRTQETQHRQHPGGGGWESKSLSVVITHARATEAVYRDEYESLFTTTIAPYLAL